MQNDLHAQDQNIWFKQFWPWFLILLPACGVVASMITISLAVINAPLITNSDIKRFAREVPAEQNKAQTRVHTKVQAKVQTDQQSASPTNTTQITPTGE